MAKKNHEEVVQKMDEEIIENTESNEEIQEGSAAMETLKPNSKPDSNPASRFEMMTKVLGAMGQAPSEELVKWFNDTMAQFGPNKDYGVADKSAANRATVNMKPSAASGIKEDLATMFEGQDLTEEFKEKASTLFEAAVHARIVLETQRLEEEFETKLNEQIEAVTTEMTDKLDTYLDFVVENWMKENEVAIESSLRNELIDDFIVSLKNVFAEHYIDVPQEKMDVLEALTTKVAELEEKLDSTISENVELRRTKLDHEKNVVFASVSEGLALTRVEKFRTLAEGIEFDGDLTAYERKLNIIKEQYFSDKPVATKTVLTEEVFEEQAEEVVSSPEMKRWAQAISRTVKK